MKGFLLLLLSLLVMSGVTENKWNFDIEVFNSDAALSHTKSVYDQLTALPFWKDSFHVLDFGCGTGSLATLLAGSKKAEKVIAVDVESVMVENAVKNIAEAGLEDVISAKHLSKLDGSEVSDLNVDCIVSVTVFGHIRIPDLAIIFSNLSKGLKQGGRLVISEFENVESSNLFQGHHHGHNHGHGHSHGEHHEHGHGHSHGEHHEHEHHEHEHGHSHGHGHLHGHGHSHGHSHGNQEFNLDVHVSDGGHAHTNINEEVLTELANGSGLQVETVQKYTHDFSSKFGEGCEAIEMILFVAKKI